MTEKSETLSGSANGQTRHMNKAHASSGTSVPLLLSRAAEFDYLS